jgi:16S rRNA G966 N2-methylase RsmD
VDLSPNCIDTALSNARKCGFDAQQFSAVCARAEDVLLYPERYLPSSPAVAPYQLVSITPPYQEVVYQELIDAVCSSPLVGTDSLIIIEYPVEMGSLPHILISSNSKDVPAEQEAADGASSAGRRLFGLRNRRYGRTVLALYVCEPSRQMDMKPAEFI